MRRKSKAVFWYRLKLDNFGVCRTLRISPGQKSPKLSNSGWMLPERGNDLKSARSDSVPVRFRLAAPFPAPTNDRGSVICGFFCYPLNKTGEGEMHSGESLREGTVRQKSSGIISAVRWIKRMCPAPAHHSNGSTPYHRCSDRKGFLRFHCQTNRSPRLQDSWVLRFPYPRRCIHKY